MDLVSIPKIILKLVLAISQFQNALQLNHCVYHEKKGIKRTEGFIRRAILKGGHSLEEKQG